MTNPVATPPFAPLPTSFTSFVGRERYITQVSTLLQSGVRLVTLTGPGGVGKTRLALRVAHDLQPLFADGVAFVPLAAISDPDLVGATIAQALGIRERSDRPARDLLIDALRARQLLLVLDNFEQIVAASPRLTEVLASCPGLRVLVTSRILLRISGEHEIPVTPLSLPDADSLTHSDETESVRLFVDRARAVNPTFVLTADNRRAVAAICQRLDGLPLALELVAAKVRLLPPHVLLPHLAKALPLLTGGPRDAPVRLQTMRNAIAWSYDLLMPEDQALLQCLAVFAGGFTLEAVEAVTSGVPNATSDVLPRMERLAEQSLIQRVDPPIPDHHPADLRFGMLETVREFADDLLATSDKAGLLSAAHADYVGELAAQTQNRILGPDQARWVSRLEAELPNVRIALDWLHATGQMEQGLRLVTDLGWFWYRRNRDREGLDHLLIFLQADIANTALRSQALAIAANLATRVGDHTQAVIWSEQALVQSQQLADQRGTASALRSLGNAVAGLGDLEGAEARFTKSLQLFQEVHATWDAALVLHWLGIVTYARERYDSAILQFSQARNLYQLAGDHVFANWMRGNIGWVSLIAHDDKQAQVAFAESLEVAWEDGDIWWLSWCLMGAGGLAARRGASVTAARLFGKSEALRSAAGAPLRPAVQAKYDVLTAACRASMTDQAWNETHAAGAYLSLAQAVDEARGVLMPDASFTEHSLAQGDTFGLTPREAEILKLVAAGHANREIAERLFISVPTVKRHMSTILSKLDLPSRPAAVAFAHTHGLA
ncbi:MAG: tetratricopeptide repeat protein [Thermomicrobiales bacterium]|nr:tetratricopeptide repeat protein [Thermomicrobiales bacterium]